MSPLPRISLSLHPGYEAHPMTDRFTPLHREDLDPRQQKVFDAIRAGPRGSVPWIFHLWLESPELCSRVQDLGALCRYGTSLPRPLSELAILIVAHHWGADYEWSIHENEARRAGLPDAVIAAIAAGETPPFGDDADAALLYEFCRTYLKNNDVPDELFARASAHFGRRTLVEIAGILGYYSMLAMAIRIFRLPPEK
jgi:4-carboxymuconolactone decarboxylase